MQRLSIFDDGALVATITIVNTNALIFARSSREWSEMQRLVNSGYFRDDEKTGEYVKINPQDEGFLEQVAGRAHSYDYNTELTSI
jgi:hypothetical protein